MHNVDPATRTILVVEDDTDIGAILLEILINETSYETVLVTDSLQALDVAKQVNPVLFILDYRLPHLNGIELYDRLHAYPHLAHVHAIMISATLPVDDLEQRGIVGLEKPIDLDTFVRTVEQMASSTSMPP